MTQLSAHFTLEELTYTKTGLPNHPAEPELDNLRRTAHALDRVRDMLGHPIIVDSGFRSVAVNHVVRGVSTSAHCAGYAVDFVCPDFGTPQEVAQRIVASDIEFDQVIFEGTWVHISFAPTMRRQALTAHFAKGKPTLYTLGVT